MTLRTGTDGGADSLAWTPLARCADALVGWWAVLRSPPRMPLGVLTVDLHRIAVLAIAALVAIVATMGTIDAAAIAWQATLKLSFVTPFEDITDFGRSQWLLVPAAVLMLVVAAVNSPTLGRVSNLVLTTLIIRLGFVFVAIGLPSLLVTVVKRLVGRVRPSDLGPFAYYPLSWRASYASLPSGHATTVFAALVAIGLVWPRARPFLLVYALTIAVSRVIVSAHYPSDVLAGAAFGVLGALLVREWFAVRRLGFVVAADGQIRTLPGPSFRRIKGVVRRLLGQ